MKVKVGERMFGIYFAHEAMSDGEFFPIRSFPLETRQNKMHQTQRRTVCRIYAINEMDSKVLAAEGIATCSLKDVFNRRTGLMMAWRRAMEVLDVFSPSGIPHFTKDEKKIFWDTFFEMLGTPRN